MFQKCVIVCMMTQKMFLGVCNRMDDDIDPKQRDFESKIENNVYLYFSHRVIYSVVMKALKIVYVTLIVVYLLCTSVGHLSIQDTCKHINIGRFSICDVCNHIKGGIGSYSFYDMSSLAQSLTSKCIGCTLCQTSKILYTFIRNQGH